MAGIALATLLNQCRGVDTGVYPNGVPTDYSWYDSGSNGLVGPRPPPSGFTAVLGWVVIYPQKNMPSVPCTIEVAELQGYSHTKTGGWTQEQFQGMRLEGGKFKDAISPLNIGGPLTITGPDAAGVSTMPYPPHGYMDHFWTAQRGTYPADTVDGYLVFMRVRLSRLDAHYVMQVGTDWWRDAGAPFLSSFANNPALGSCDWVKLTAQWQWIGFTNITEAVLRAEPPPNVDMGVVIVPPPVEPPPPPPPVEPPPPVIPEGYVLVPMVPTQAMLTAAINAGAEAAWHAALAAVSSVSS